MLFPRAALGPVVPEVPPGKLDQRLQIVRIAIERHVEKAPRLFGVLAPKAALIPDAAAHQLTRVEVGDGTSEDASGPDALRDVVEFEFPKVLEFAGNATRNVRTHDVGNDDAAGVRPFLKTRGDVHLVAE